MGSHLRLAGLLVFFAGASFIVWNLVWRDGESDQPTPVLPRTEIQAPTEPPRARKNAAVPTSSEPTASDPRNTSPERALLGAVRDERGRPVDGADITVWPLMPLPASGTPCQNQRPGIF
jgi:hypothetical protein